MAADPLAPYLVPNMFDPRHYFVLDIGPGRLTTRSGAKMVTFSSTALRGLYLGLYREAGPAWVVILKRCGEIWGERYCRRLFGELEAYYREGVRQMKMGRFLAALTEAFATHGWGRFEFDLEHVNRGVIVVGVHNPIMTSVLPDVDEPQVDVLIAGVLKSILRELTGEDLDCHQTERLRGDAPFARFVLSHTARLEAVPAMLESRKSHDEIVASVLEKTA
jgi:predicted hydrocarbon binding protein